jgi:hypothetical protein
MRAEVSRTGVRTEGFLLHRELEAADAALRDEARRVYVERLAASGASVELRRHNAGTCSVTVYWQGTLRLGVPDVGRTLKNKLV